MQSRSVSFALVHTLSYVCSRFSCGALFGAMPVQQLCSVPMHTLEHRVCMPPKVVSCAMSGTEQLSRAAVSCAAPKERCTLAFARPITPGKS